MATIFEGSSTTSSSSVPQPATKEREDSYMLDENPGELSRLSDLHDLTKATMGGLVLAPVDFSQPGLRILDSGTADAYWLRDLASEMKVPHTYIGTDITTAFFPSNLPSNITLYEQSISKPWPASWHSSFDLVHQRLTLPGAGTFPLSQVVRNLVELVKPGGWIQLVEAEQIIAEDDGPVMRGFLKLIRSVFEYTGAGWTYARELEGWLRDAGCTDIHTKMVEKYLGAKHPDPVLAEKGVNTCRNAAAGLCSHAKGFPGMPFTAEEMKALPERLGEEIRARGAYYPLRVVWARRPL